MGISAMAHLLTVSYSASRFGGDSQEICLQKLGVFLPVDLLTVSYSASSLPDRKWGLFLLSRFTDCQLIQHIWRRQSRNLLAEMV